MWWRARRQSVLRELRQHPSYMFHSLLNYKFKYSWVGQVYFSSFNTSSRGVATLIQKNLPSQLTKCIKDKSGRFVITIMNLYCPLNYSPDSLTKAFSEFVSSPLALVVTLIAWWILNLINIPHETLPYQTRLGHYCQSVGKSTWLIYGKYCISLIENLPFSSLTSETPRIDYFFHTPVCDAICVFPLNRQYCG